MSAVGIPTIVTRESGRFNDLIYSRQFARSPWVRQIKRAAYPRGLSPTINVLTYERTAPYEANPTWADAVPSDGQEGGTCLPPVKNISVGSTTRNFNLQHYAVEGPDFCAMDFQSVFQLEAQLGQIADVLSEYTTILWELRDRNEYFRLCQTKVVVNDCYNPTATTTGAAAYPAVQATYPLSMSVLNKFRAKLLRDGASAENITSVGGGPLLIVMGSSETIGNLIRQNTDIRNDIRYAEMGDGPTARLLQSYGVAHSYGGFIFIEDVYSRRFTYAAGVYTNIATFEETAASQGNKAIVRAAYDTATHDETFIFDASVLTQLVPEPITNPQMKFKFDPVRYTGDWQVKNVPDRVRNPDGTILYHRGVLSSATMPVHPERGVAFVHLRCEPLGCSTTCT